MKGFCACRPGKLEDAQEIHLIFSGDGKVDLKIDLAAQVFDPPHGRGKASLAAIAVVALRRRPIQADAYPGDARSRDPISHLAREKSSIAGQGDAHA